MEEKIIKKLAIASYKNNKLDEDNVDRIIVNLNRRELRGYIKALKVLQSRIRVYVEYSKELSGGYKKEVEELFPNKEVIFKKNDDLLMGIRITENDIVSNINLNNSLKKITAYFDKYI